MNYYGRSKWESEQQVAWLCSNYAVARIVVVYGQPLPGQHGNIVRLVADRLRNGQPIRVVNDQWRTPTFVDDVAQGVEQLISQPSKGAWTAARILFFPMVSNRPTASSTSAARSA